MFNIEPLLLQIKDRRPVVIVAPLVLGLLAGGLLVVKPGLSHLRGTQADISSLKEKVQPYLYVLEGESKLLNFKKQFSGDKAWFIEQINSIAEKSGVSVLSVLPEESGKIGDFLERLSVHIDVEASYHQLGLFVSQLESLDPYVKILTVDISRGGGETGQSSAAWQGGGPRASSTKNVNVCQASLSVGLIVPAAGAL